MFSYEDGLAVAFLLWLLTTIVLIVSINSRFERNLNKIGQRLSWVTLTLKPMDAGDTNRSAFRKLLKFLLIVGIGLPFVFLSWLYVAMFFGMFFYKRVKDAGAPQIVREFRWKLKNMDMSFDQLVKELMKFEEDSVNPEKLRENLIEELQDRGLTNEYGR